MASAKTTKTSPVTGVTVRKMIESVRPRISEGGKGLGGLVYEKVVKDPQAVITFDAHYKPYICELIKKHHTDLEVEGLYHEVLLKLMLGAIDRFDMDQPRVGKGAFRNYLKKVVASVVSDALDAELVPVYNPDGTPVFTKEPMKDKHGKVKTDDKGNVIYKQKKMSKVSFDAENIQNAIAQTGFGGVIGRVGTAEWTSREISKFRYVYMQLAYLILTAEKMKSKREGWIFKAMMDIFESGKDDEVVREDLLKRGIINDSRPFYVAKTRYLNEWKEIQEREIGKILKKVRLDAKSIKGCPGKDKPLRKGVYEWRPIVNREEAVKIARTLADDVTRQVGKARVKFVMTNFSRMAKRLIEEAEKEMFEKNAWRFNKIAQELQEEKDEKAREEAKKAKSAAKEGKKAKEKRSK